MGRFKSNCPVRAGVDVKNIDCIGLFLICLCQSCSYLMLYWVFCVGGVFSCILEIELRSARVHVHAIKRSYKKDESPGWHSTLMDLGKLVLVS